MQDMPKTFSNNLNLHLIDESKTMINVWKDREVIYPSLEQRIY
jgi:hypothetical protein